MSINAQQVKALRDRTGAGMMDCKKALIDTSGDEEQAVEILRKKGLAKVAKKAGAIAAEGLVHAYIHAGARVGVMLEVNCQTDFVARNEEFKQFVEDCGMQIASMSPLFVRREEVPADEIAKQKKFFVDQMAEEAEQTGKAKPAAAIEKIVEGKLDKWLKESCLVEQVSIMAEGKETIDDICDALTAKIGEKIFIRRFVRYELGEGIEKKVSNLAADVAETLAQA